MKVVDTYEVQEKLNHNIYKKRKRMEREVKREGKRNNRKTTEMVTMGLKRGKTPPNLHL